jgi:hypothetical protein
VWNGIASALFLTILNPKFSPLGPEHNQHSPDLVFPEIKTLIRHATLGGG